MRILLVEDDESIREVFKMILETENRLPDLSVATASNGQEAVAEARQTRPDVVLLDLTLEGENGFDVFKQLRNLEGLSQVPIIAVTAHNLSEMQQQAREMGFSGFVTKPIDFETSLFPLLREIASGQTTHAA